MASRPPTSPATVDRVQPQAVEVERAVLGAMMIDNGVIPRVVEILGDESAFYQPAHRRIYAALLSLFVWGTRKRQPADLPTHGNPSSLKSAMLFGLLYAIVIFAVAAAKESFGTGGLYIVAAISGLTDMDAITLSNAQLTKAGRLTYDTGWRLIIVASLANLAFKAGTVALLGNATLLKKIVRLYGIAFAAGVGLIAFW